MLKRLTLLAVAILLSVPSFAAQISVPGACAPIGGYDTFANLQAAQPASVWYPCTQAWAADTGPLWNDGNGTWRPISFYAGGTTFSAGTPNSRSLSLATAFQATNTAKAAVVTVNLSSTANLTLTTGATNTATIVIGSTNAVASGTGTVIGSYNNSLTGSLVVGINMSTTSTSPITFVLPAGWFFAVRQTSGAVTITSAFDQSIG